VAIKLACQRLASVGGTLLGSVLANVSQTESFYSYSTSSVREGESSANGERPSRRRALVVHLSEPTPSPSTKQD
jgi:hypothetical protein